MKNYRAIIKIALTCTLMSNLSFGASTPLTEVKLKELGSTVKILNRSNITVIDGIDEGSYYFLELNVKKNGRVKKVNAFLDKKSGAIYIGSRYDSNGKKSIFPKTDRSIGIIKNGISFSYGNGKEDLYIVTDPQCPYCKTFEKEAQGKLDKYTVHVLLYPLSFHKEAPAMTEWIMQGKNGLEKKKRMEDVMLHNSTEYKTLMTKKDQNFKYSPSIKSSLDDTNKAVKTLGATGTPSVYTGDFNKISWKSLTKAQVTKLPKFNKITKPTQK